LNSDFNELVSNNLHEAKVNEEQSFSGIAKKYLLPIRPLVLRVRMDQRISKDKMIRKKKIVFFKELYRQAILQNYAISLAV
jgi:hypothetical protein